MTTNRYKILVIEDEANIRNVVKTILATCGYQVLEAQNIKEGKLMFLSHLPDLVILDLGMPDGDGMDLLRMIRAESMIPVIVLSARVDETDKVEALDLGANDYVTKPFGTAELTARVRAALRTYRQSIDRNPETGKVFSVNGMEINYEMRRVTVHNEEIHLTQTEYNILVLLAGHAGRVLTYAEIIREIWHWSDSGSIKKLQVNMANIRKKLGQKPGDNQFIQNELGVGYRMNINTEDHR